MSLKQMNAIVTGELRHIPKGRRGSAQQIYRQIYWCARMNSLGRHSEVFSAAEAHHLALTIARRWHPGFQPIFR